jgi:hypothetical protein
VRVCRYIWIDAFCPDDVWHYGGEAFEYEERIIETVGYCVHQDRRYYAVAGTHDPTTGGFCNLILIPRGCVIRVEELDRLPDSGVVDGAGFDLPAAGHP